MSRNKTPLSVFYLNIHLPRVGVLGGNIPPPRAKALSTPAPRRGRISNSPSGGGVREPPEPPIPRVGDPMLPEKKNNLKKLFIFYLLFGLTFQIFDFVQKYKTGLIGISTSHKIMFY